MAALKDVGVGELIGKVCITADGVELGEIVYTARDRSGDPEWIDVAFADAVRDEHGWDHERVRMSASHVLDYDDRVLELSVALDRLTGRWRPVDPEPIQTPSFETEEAQAG